MPATLMDHPQRQSFRLNNRVLEYLPVVSDHRYVKIGRDLIRTRKYSPSYASNSIDIASEICKVFSLEIWQERWKQKCTFGHAAESFFIFAKKFTIDHRALFVKC
jgi:hypothetical protein